MMWRRFPSSLVSLMHLLFIYHVAFKLSCEDLLLLAMYL